MAVDNAELPPKNFLSPSLDEEPEGRVKRRRGDGVPSSPGAQQRATDRWLRGQITRKLLEELRATLDPSEEG
jgi:hypothetical protein